MNQQNGPTIIGDKKIEIDGFTFGEKSLKANLARLTVLLMCIDPTPKQKEILEKLDIILLDDFNKQFFPRIEEKKEENKEEFSVVRKETVVKVIKEANIPENVKKDKSLSNENK